MSVLRRALAAGTLLLGAALAAGTLPSAAPAQAAAPPAAPHPRLAQSVVDGTWFNELFGIPEIHARGITGEGVTVAVLDTPVNPEVPDLRGAKLEPRTEQLCDNGYDGLSTDSEAEHGTNMIEVIAGRGGGSDGEPGVPGVAPDARVLHYAVLSEAEAVGCEVKVAPAVQDAVENGARIVSMSFGWGDLADLYNGVRIALEAGAVVDIAVQNEDGERLDDTSAANGVVAIENTDYLGLSDGFEVSSERLTVVAPGVNIRGTAHAGGAWDRYALNIGTSPATAWTSGVLALAAAKWPEATGNQLIQSLIRNTSNGWEELSRTDIEGFGLVSPQNLVTVDPTIYPDANPLLVDQGGVEPGWAEVAGDRERVDWGFVAGTADRGTSVPVAVPTVRPVSWTVVNRHWLVPGLLALAAVLGAFAVLLPILSRRRPPSPVPRGPGRPGPFAVPGAGFAPGAGPGPLPPPLHAPPWGQGPPSAVGPSAPPASGAWGRPVPPPVPGSAPVQPAPPAPQPPGGGPSWGIAPSGPPFAPGPRSPGPF
ncbi:MAG: S8 family serine peptidase [Pseudoclavibacter sp.]|nr:S8 family serine peptidase [Pseudoclavibacter sp.]